MPRLSGLLQVISWTHKLVLAYNADISTKNMPGGKC